MYQVKLKALAPPQLMQFNKFYPVGQQEQMIKITFITKKQGLLNPLCPKIDIEISYLYQAKRLVKPPIVIVGGTLGVFATSVAAAGCIT